MREIERRTFLLTTLTLTAIVSSVSALSPTTGSRDDLHYSIKEELQPGSLIAEIAADAGLHELGIEALNSLRFKFLNQPTSGGLAIDERTGVIRNTDRLDRDSLCGQEPTCQIRLDIAVQPMTYFQLVKVTIDLDDVNDNSPTFQPDSRTHEMLESSVVGTTLVLQAAVDADRGNFSVVDYRLEPESENFELRKTKKLDQSTDLRLVLVHPLDRELQAEHHLKVVALDGGTPPNTGFLHVEIIVLDANDNSPVFEANTYEARLIENSPLLTRVLQVHATDRDIGTNAVLTYYLSATSQANYGKTFSIDNITGEIFVTGVVDYETNRIYQLMVSARDQGPDPISSDAMVVINVEDANDNAPKITVNTLLASDTDVARVAEDAVLGTFVAHVIVRDPDSGENGRFNCSLDSESFQLRGMYESEFHIITAKAPLDRERIDRYDLQLSCQDGGHPPLHCDRKLLVEVSDVNDNSPQFSQTSYATELLENNYVGAFVVHVNALDVDLAENAKVTYSLPDAPRAFFSVDRETGLITAKASLNREEQAHYRFDVYASDSGSPRRMGTAVVELNVLDVNDEKPAFLSPTYSFTVGENRPPGERVGRLGARDSDSPPYDQFSFSLLDSGSLSDAFSVDRALGLVTTTRTLDREDQDTYHLVAVVRDDNSPALSGTTVVVVSVGDVNDCAPIFVQPEDVDDAAVLVSNLAARGHVVTSVKAIDHDFGENGRIFYSIEEESDEPGLFAVDRSRGLITITRGFHGDVDNRVTLLKVKATDHGLPRPLSSSLILRIFINHTSTLPPQSRYDSLALVGRRVSVVVAVSCASGFLLVLLILALVCAFRRRRRAHGHGPGKYNCRMEALKVLTVKDVSSGGLVAETGNGPLVSGGVAAFRGVASAARTDDGWANRSGLQPMITTGVGRSGPDEDIYERIALKKLEMYELVGPQHRHHQQGEDDQPTPSRRGTFEARRLLEMGDGLTSTGSLSRDDRCQTGHEDEEEEEEAEEAEDDEKQMEEETEEDRARMDALSRCATMVRCNGTLGGVGVGGGRLRQEEAYCQRRDAGTCRPPPETPRYQQLPPQTHFSCCSQPPPPAPPSRQQDTRTTGAAAQETWRLEQETRRLEHETRRLEHETRRLVTSPAPPDAAAVTPSPRTRSVTNSLCGVSTSGDRREGGQLRGKRGSPLHLNSYSSVV